MGIIYKITHKETGKCYIGQTKMSLEWRLNNAFCGHFVHAFTNKYDKSHFHLALRKYGKEAFTYEVIEECNDNKLNEREIYWIAYYNSNDKYSGYNMTSGGNYPAISFRQKYRKLSVTTKLKISSSVKKLWENKEYRNKIKYAKTQNKTIEKHNNISNSQKLLWQNDEYRERMRHVRKQQATDEFKHKVSDGQKRRWQNDEYRAKMSIIRKEQAARVNSSPEYRQKMSLASKRAWAKRKGAKNDNIL